MQAPRIVRWTLPALLLTLVIGALLIVAASGREEPSERPGASGSSGAQKSTSSRKRAKARRATVRPGDTITAIARRTKRTEIELLKLNPNVDPRALRAGQRLKISP